MPPSSRRCSWSIPRWWELLLGLLPLASGLAIAAIPSVRAGMRRAGADVPARPPAAAFGVAWGLLYTMLGASWVVASMADRAPRAQAVVHASYSATVASLCAWLLVYTGGAKGAKKDALYAMVAALMLAAATAGVAATRCEVAALLAAPLLGWLVFACNLNVAEVNSAR